MKKQFLILFAFISVLALSQVPQRFNKVIVTGDITSPKFIKNGSNADSVLLGNGSARAISTIKTDTVSLSNRINAKATGNGTVNGTNTGDETLTSIKTKLGSATSVSDGYLKYQDFVRFDGKLSSEVDGSTTNELQTISTTGAAGNITLSNSGGTLNLNVNDADASPTNEIQDLSLTGNMLTLSSDAPVDVSQATAVQANTAKVSNVTHTGDVTGSTALTLATVNGSIGTFNNVTINAKGLATAGSNVSYEPAFSKNTGFNKNFGTTAGTVLEGRTFGTAANSAVGDFIQNQNASAQSANMWISGDVKARAGAFSSYVDVLGTVSGGNNFIANTGGLYFNGYNNYNAGIFSNTSGTGLTFQTGSNTTLTLNTSGAATFSSTVNSTGFLLNGNNLTSSLTTNFIPKWNGSNFVNSLISDDGSHIGIRTTTPESGWSDINDILAVGTSGYARIYMGSKNATQAFLQSRDLSVDKDLFLSASKFVFQGTGSDVSIASTTTSTSPTTGALVVGGGVGADHVRANKFYGNGSNLTGVQLPITLTTNGTSGAATFSGNVLNVPNYTSSGGVNQTQTTVNGSTGGNMVCSMPFQTGAYKKVMIRFSSLSGNASYSYPTVFTTQPSISSIYQQVGTPGTYTTGGAGASAFTITGASGLSGWIFIEGY